MNAKKIAGFLLMRPALTQRNLTSMGLVGLFFVVYILMGGKVTTELPRMNKDGSFGAAAIDPLTGARMKKQPAAEEQSAPQQGDAKSKSLLSDPRDVLGINQSEEREARRRAAMGSQFFSEGERKAAEEEELDKDGLVKGVKIKRNRIDWNKRREERELKKRDMLSDIEERLQMK